MSDGPAAVCTRDQFSACLVGPALTLDDGLVTMGGGFGSQSYVGVAGPWGAVELGRQLTPLFNNLLAISPFGVNPNWGPVQMIPKTDGQGSAIASLAPPLRQNNLVRYRHGDVGSPGWRFELAAAPGEASTSTGRYLTASVSHRGQAYFVALTSQRSYSGAAAASAFHVDTHVLGGVTTIGACTVSAQVARTSSNAAASLNANTLLLGGTYTFGRQVLRVEAARRDVKGSARDADLVTLGLDHNLSRRTTLYVRALALQNKGLAANTMALATVNANSGHDVQAWALGMRHNF